MALTIELPTGRRLEIESETLLIGRDKSCHVALPDQASLQPQHARIKRIADRWLIESLGDWLIQVGDAPAGRKNWLRPGDAIRLSERGPTIVFDPPPSAAVIALTEPTAPPLSGETPSLPAAGRQDRAELEFLDHVEEPPSRFSAAGRSSRRGGTLRAARKRQSPATIIGVMVLLALFVTIVVVFWLASM
jgi:hypothetical protein